MPRAKKSEISPENIGKLFWKPGEDIPYRLVSCETEPRAKMLRADMAGGEFEPVSTFSDFVLVKGMPESKPSRSDKGGTHTRKLKAKPENPDADLAQRVLAGTPLGG